MKSILIGVLCVVVVVVGWTLWDMTFVTFDVPDDFSGPLAVIERRDGQIATGFWKWKRYEVRSSGVLAISDSTWLYHWHILTIRRESGVSIDELRERNTTKSGYWAFGTRWRMQFDETTSDFERRQNAISFYWIGKLSEMNARALDRMETEIREEAANQSLQTTPMTRSEF